jgi:hypothetical protein
MIFATVTDSDRALEQLIQSGESPRTGLLEDVAGRCAVSSPQAMADLFTRAALLASAAAVFAEERWLAENPARARPTAGRERDPFAHELLPLLGFAPFLQQATQAELRRAGRRAEALVAKLAARARGLDCAMFQEFARAAIAAMARLAKEAEMPAADDARFSLYRAFDAMDEALGLDYGRDLAMKRDLRCAERLYEGAGAGVQTSYATILVALDRLCLAPGALFIDLGSGYGRVGLALGLLRADVDFIGYEFVPHRVAVAEAAAERAGLAARVRFCAQDLADPAFVIPPADVYYLYDPFSRATYARVFARLREIGRGREIAVVVKGNGAPWFVEAISGEPWITEQPCDQGTTCVFRSRPLRKLA